MEPFAGSVTHYGFVPEEGDVQYEFETLTHGMSERARFNTGMIHFAIMLTIEEIQNPMTAAIESKSRGSDGGSAPRLYGSD